MAVSDRALGFAFLAIVAGLAAGVIISQPLLSYLLGAAWSIKGTDEGVSLVYRSSGAAGVLYDLGVGGGLAITTLGGRVMLWLSDAVVSTNAGQSLISESDGITTLYDLGDNGFATFDVSSPGLITVARTAPEITISGVSVTSTSANALTYFASAAFIGKQDTVIATDGSTWTHVTMSGIVTLQFNATGYINVFTTVPTFAVVNSTYTPTMYFNGPISASVGMNTADGTVIYTPSVRLETTPAGWVGGVPTITWAFITGSTLNFPITLFVHFNGYARLS